MKQSLRWGWEVEWCEHVDGFEDGSVDMESAKYKRKDFAKRGPAIRFAKSKLPDPLGAVKVTQWEMKPVSEDLPSILEREYIGDVEWIDE